MTSVQTLPSIHSTKIHHTASSPVVKPSPHAFKVVESSSKKMNGHVNGSGGQENGAPATSSDQVKKHWNDFGAMIQGLLQTPIQFTRYDDKDDVHPELKYKALNTGALKENGSGLAGLTKVCPTFPLCGSTIVACSISCQSLCIGGFRVPFPMENRLSAVLERPSLRLPPLRTPITLYRVITTCTLKPSRPDGLIKATTIVPRVYKIWATLVSPIRSCKS